MAVLLLAWGPSVARAAEVDEGEGYVRITKLETRETREGRGIGEPFIRVKITVENRLEMAVDGLFIEVPVRERYSSSSVSEVHFWGAVPARGQYEFESRFARPTVQPLTGATVRLKRYRLDAAPSRTPGVASTLLRLANSRSRVDQAVAAEMLPRLTPDAVRLREELRLWVASGPVERAEDFGAGIGPLYALRLLGRVGTGEDVALLLSALKSDEAHGPALAALESLRAWHPPHPMAGLFGSGAGVREVVEAALRDMRPELVVPEMVKLAYLPGTLQHESRTLLSAWKVEEPAAALSGPRAAESLQVLCASGTPDVVPLVVRLGITGVEGVDMKACLSALPERDTLGELVRVLGDELGALEGVALEVLASRGRARALLLARARELGIPAEQDSGKLVRAVRARLFSLRTEAFLKVLAEAEEASREERYEAALQLLGQARELARGREQRIRVAAAQARVGQAVVRDDVRRVDPVIDALVALPAEWASDAELEPELVKLVQAIIVQEFTSGSEQLARIEQWGGAAVHPRLAQAYMDVAGELNAPYSLGESARRALALDSGNAAARHVLEKLKQDRARETRRIVILVGAGLLGLSVLVSLLRWREASKNRARKRRAVELLANGTSPRVVAEQLVFEEGLSYGDASLLLAEAQEEVQRARGA
ncbi:hypothetical protein ACLESO_29105 [Pyxidicoccus sp. 3LG]